MRRAPASISVLLLVCLAAAGASACVVKGGGGRTRLGLGIQQDFSQASRDPDPTRPLGAETSAPILDPLGPPGTASSPAGEALFSTLAALAARFAGGGALLLQASGSFDEVVIFEWFRGAFGLGD